ncbi:MarR family transcriptional regulator [Dactylosporangium sp. NPDC051484]|uniref:MarR family transcriptional regulator n=1 Tax=Dactylosporangium sp. NPDC051484 TaxID=3154942 RepID=UPI00344D613C
MPTTTPAAAMTPTAEAVAHVLAAHPDGITVRDLAEAAGIGASTASKALTAMEAAGTATRAPGPANGNRKPADVWHPATDDTTPEADTHPADTANDTTDSDTATSTTDEPTGTTDNEEADMPADTTSDDTAAPATATEPSADESPTTDDPAIPAPTVADEAPAPAAPRKPDLKVMLMAGVLGDHPDGVSAVDAINESGLAVGVADTILAAMEVAGAAVRRVADDGTETWVLGEADLATVDPANAPTHVTCAACGHTRRIRRASAAVASRRAGTGRPAPDVNSDGSDRLMKNGLRNRVEAFMRDLGPGHRLTPGTVARELGRSSGAVGNAMHRLANDGVLMLVNEAPVTFELDPDAPAPTALVATLLPVPALTAPAAPDASATGSAPTGDTVTTAPADTATVAPTADAPGELIAA